MKPYISDFFHYRIDVMRIHIYIKPTISQKLNLHTVNNVQLSAVSHNTMNSFPPLMRS